MVPASGDVRPTTNMTMRYIIEHGLEAKTIGVFSQCDQTQDHDVLKALVLNAKTELGEDPETLGYVQLKSWIATMLQPPTDPVFQTHNFERLCMQQREEDRFFEGGSQKLRELRARKRAGICHGLVPLLEKEYSDYLNTTWKDGAMMKIVEKKIEIELQIQLIGTVEGSQRDDLAKQEIDRRFAGPLENLYGCLLNEGLRHDTLVANRCEAVCGCQCPPLVHTQGQHAQEGFAACHVFSV